MIPGAFRESTPRVRARPACLLLAVACLLHPGQLSAQDAAPVQGFTAQIEAARAAFDRGDFGEAAERFARLDREFGRNPQAQPTLDANRSLHALALVRTADFEAALPVIEKSLALPELTPPARDLLAYFRGVALVKLQRWAEGREALLAYFSNVDFDRERRMDALLAAGATHLEEGDAKEAATFFRKAMDRLQEADPALAARAALLRLRALLAGGELDDALRVVREGYADMDAQPQIITFQRLTLRLGQMFLEAGRWHDAITCFQRVWSRERLLHHQRDRLAGWERRRLVALRAPNRADEVWRLERLRAAVLPELSRIEQEEGFDATVRFRLARAFLKLERWREAAMVIEHMLRDLPPDALVEQASLPLLQCWMQARRWAKVVESADLYEERFAGRETPSLPAILFHKALALENAASYAEAAAVCASLERRFPEAGLADEAAFKQGFLLLLADDAEAGLTALRAFPGNHPDSPLAEDAFYWEGEALALLERHEEARSHLKDYLDRCGEEKDFRGDYVAAAEFRRAFCLFALADYEGAVTEFTGHLVRHPGTESEAEARLLLGDALCGLGRLDEGVEAYAAVPPEGGRFFHEAVFKHGKVLRLRGEAGSVREHFADYLQAHPGSSRAAEAVHWMAWAWRQEGNSEAAREVAWKAVEELGADPGQVAVEDILDSLVKAHRGDPRMGNLLLARLEEMAQARPPDGPDILACRARWARARFFQPDDPVRYKAEMLLAQERFSPRDHHPRLGVDIAAALEETGLDGPATELLIEVRRWHPRMLEKARLFALLGRMAMRRGDDEAARDHYRRFEEEAVAPSSALRGEVALAMARIEAEDGLRGQALGRLRAIQSDRQIPARTRAEAFFEAGMLQRDSAPATAAPFFERVYVAYGGFEDLAARAYLERARCLRELGRASSAAEVLDELLGRGDLAEETDVLGEARQLRRKLP